ncbi:ubiquinol-cytochrome c reductase iron-sulfur subunit [Lusitaniella coriacea LEGE 07157]|uniref:Ubiquinol-cytochrome c reductase iron-sulfur subunit n=1 Tax=Lusitaniella coriacea LEGE 07157 TaxID=945747 RepID=A0A8J7AZ59_9CYAN|nr:ubiquinol-cytochrome c reductase iron-sulfur subunit [Lusitaniella coriacea]MBE9115349.1 ubiquinol-cytochrome c reductase iron-sulfur subunit [Lusitaniella coriacea LEGE 07157]
MDRRQFLTWVGVGTLASSLPVVLAACNPQKDTETASTPSPDNPEIDKSVRPDGFQAIGTVEELEQDGKIFDRATSAQPILVVRNPETNTITALNPTCTHAACTVELDAANQVLACPCHGSKFALDGKVLAKPAPEPLPVFETKQEENLVLVKVS